MRGRRLEGGGIGGRREAGEKQWFAKSIPNRQEERELREYKRFSGFRSNIPVATAALINLNYEIREGKRNRGRLETEGGRGRKGVRAS
jgi:hypothetical protein